MKAQDICYRAFELMRDKQFEPAALLLTNHLGKMDDPVDLGVLHSAMGVLEKSRGKPKAALKHYQRAEKLIQDDPALKLITARLLIEEFAEYDAAIRRCEKAIDLIPTNPVVVHHALTLEGIAHGKRGRRAKAVEFLRASVLHGFTGFATTQNIDFHLVKFCVGKRWGLDACSQFLEAALRFAQSVNESVWVETIQKILDAMPTDEAPEE